MLRVLSRYPVIPAVLVALCGISLIVLGLVYPSGRVEHRPTLAEIQQKHEMALAEVMHSGVSGNVSSKDFSDGLGLALNSPVAQGQVILTIPEHLAISVDRPHSCVPPQEMTGGWRARTWAMSGRGFWPESPNLACEVERRVVADVARKKATRLTGVLSLMVVEWLAAKGLVASTAAAPEVLQLLPDLQWQQENGLFALDPEELRVLGSGTSMHHWRDVAVNETSVALEYITSELGPLLGAGRVTLDHVRWAYLVVHGFGQGEGPGPPPEDLELPSQVWFLWPLFLARPTAEPEHAALLRHNKAEQVYEVLAPRDMAASEELLFLDLRLTDASALCFRGVWVTAKHRAQLKLPLSSRLKGPSVPLMQKYGCLSQTQNLNLIVPVSRDVAPAFLSCMRMAAADPEMLQRLETRGWFDNWPLTLPIDQRNEQSAAQLAVELLQKVLERLTQSNNELRQRFGSASVVQRPCVRVREAETMVVVSLLKSMQELALLSSNEYLFEALRDAQRESLQEA